MIKKIHSLAIAMALLTGCSHALHIYQSGDVVPLKGKEYRRIKSEAEQFVVLGFVTQTDYADQAYKDLMSKCTKGEITGINTRSSTSHSFLSWTNKVHMEAYCIE